METEEGLDQERPRSANSGQRFRIGIDIGGTFTDLVALVEESGEIHNLKLATTVPNPAAGVAEGIAKILASSGLSVSECSWLSHGQTIGLNSILTRTGAAAGVIVTKGFGDMLEMGRLKLPDPFDLYTQRTPPLVRRNRVREVTERTAANGDIIVELDLDELEKVARELIEIENVEALVVSFLHSYSNPGNEVAASEHLRTMFPDIEISSAAQLWPQAREYERTMVGVMNAYVSSPVRSYIGALQDSLRALEIPAPLLICTSNGGITSAERASREPVTTLLSGPAAGIVAANYLKEASDLGQVVTFDMGGTSADMAVLNAESLPYSRDRDIDGIPITIPCLDLSSIGAGGGSIAHVDDFGVLKVGPASTGADPGPAAYGLGGVSATITDAYVALGIIDPSAFAAGQYQLDPQLAEQAIATLADAMGLNIESTAEGILRVATANLAREFSRLVARHGVDSRDLTLLAFGGAGPTHGCLLADELGVGTVAIPIAPGTFSALGTLAASFRLDFIKTVYAPLDQLNVDDVAAWYHAVEAEGRSELKSQDERIEGIRIEKSANVRFQLQGYDIEVAYDSFEDLDTLFRERYYEIYGSLDQTNPLEVVSLQATVVGDIDPPHLATIPESLDQAESAESRRVFLDGEWRTIPVFYRAALKANRHFVGPAVVVQDDTTTLITEGWAGTSDEIGTIVLRKTGENK